MTYTKRVLLYLLSVNDKSERDSLLYSYLYSVSSIRVYFRAVLMCIILLGITVDCALTLDSALGDSQ